MVAEAFLVRDRAGAPEVGEAELAAFLAEEATPRFPDGLTVLDAAGQWRGADGRVLRERSKLLVIALPGAEAWYARCLSLPLFPGMEDADVDRVVEALAEAAGG